MPTRIPTLLLLLPLLATATLHAADPATAADSATAADPAAAPAASAAATATFIGLDTTTLGNWSKSFGADGYMLPDGTAKNPAYAHLATTGTQVWTWAATIDEPRCTTIDADSGHRSAFCWYSALMSFDITCTDNDSHLVTFYALDWDRLSRTEHVDVLDSTGAVLNAQDLSSFGDGVHATWKISGHVTFRFTNTGPQNAVISGIFFGPGTAKSTPPVDTAAPATAAVAATAAATAAAASP